MRKCCQNFAEGHKTSQNLGSKVLLNVEQKWLSTWEAGLEWLHHQERIKRCLLGDLGSERYYFYSYFYKNKNNISGIIYMYIFGGGGRRKETLKFMHQKNMHPFFRRTRNTTS